MRELFCVDAPVEQALKRYSAEEHQVAMAGSVYYIWETARYWKGPIKKFHLIIDKDAPTDLVSLCPNVVQKTSPTRFEWQQTDFVPEGMVRVLFIKKPNQDN